MYSYIDKIYALTVYETYFEIKIGSNGCHCLRKL